MQVSEWARAVGCAVANARRFRHIDFNKHIQFGSGISAAKLYGLLNWSYGTRGVLAIVNDDFYADGEMVRWC